MVANIGDVAREAGVSRSTVSYALSGKRPISLETRERIDEAIARLGFTVNAGARALATSQTMVIGLLLRFHDDEFPPAMLQYILAITKAARTEGYDVLLVTEEQGAEAVRRLTSSNMIDGLIMLDVTHDDPRLAALRESRVPGALIGIPRDTKGVDVFDLDFGAAARLLVDHLYGLGHRNIVLVTPPRHVFERGVSYSWRFRDAALEQAAHHQISIAVHYGESQQPAVSRSLNRILDARPDATAWIVHNDASIVALPGVLRERGIEVPRDLSVVSLFPKNFARSFLLPYSAVETSPEELGRRAVQHLVHRISTVGSTSPIVGFVEPTLTIRGTTA